MKINPLWLSLALIAAMSSAAWPTDISGEWKPDATRQNPGITRALYEFKVEGSKLTGSVLGFMQDEWPILEGKVTKDKVFFTLKEREGNRVYEYRYNGKITGDTIKFTVYMVGARNKYWKFTARKVSP